MGMFKHLMRAGLETGAKSLMGAADAATGGLASKLTNTVIKGAGNNAGLIGKVASGIGKSMFTDDFRKKMSSVADKALDYLPEGNVKTALTKINDEAQGRKGKYAPSNSSPSPLMSSGSGGGFHSRATQRRNWNNPSHEPNRASVGSGEG